MKVTQTETFKRLSNQKVALGVLTLIMCLALIAVCSFSTLIIDPSRIQTAEFLTNELIIIAIVIMSMISTMFIGQASNALNDKSRLAKARAAFKLSLEQVKAKGLNAFRQWVKKVLEKEDILLIKERKIRALGIDDFTILDLEDSQIKELEKPQKYGDRFYKSLSKEQIAEVIKIKHIRNKIVFVEPEYYLSVSTITDSRTVSERASNENKKKGSFLLLRLLGKLVITVISGMIFASLVTDLTGGEVEAATAWARFLSRLWSMISSAFMGYLLGVQLNDIDAEYVEMRTTIHTRFLEDKTFVALSQQEEAKQEFIDRVAEEQVLKLEMKEE